MNKILATLLIVGSTVALGACAGNIQDAGNAGGRTAGDKDQPLKVERQFKRGKTFTRAQTK